MTSIPIVPQLRSWPKRFYHHLLWPLVACRLLFDPHLSEYLRHPRCLPRQVRHSPVARRYLNLLAPLHWQRFPERDLSIDWGIPTVPYLPFVASYLIKLDQQLTYMSNLRAYLVEHPALTWALGFPLPRCLRLSDSLVDAHLPTQRHFARILRRLPNASLQVLLDDTVRLLQLELASEVSDFGRTVSLDTKHILAWVKENNPKAYVSDRYNKHQQPPGDPDCRVGCKRKRNQRTPQEKRASTDDLPTPLHNPQSPQGIPLGEYYWGYATGVVATKCPGWGEFVLAELTQPFDRADVSYFQPLMADTQRRLGCRPHFGAFDAGFDAFYVYEYFHREGQPWQTAFAAVPWAQRGPARTFDAQGLPLCNAGLPMPLKSTFMCRTTLVHHERGRYACPLLYPEPRATACPVDDKHWAKGGCVTTMATSIGARLRHQIDRESELYKEVYKQRTATERINSQAKALGIERPKLRNGQAITNLNTLIYILINLRALQRVREQKAKRVQ